MNSDLKLQQQAYTCVQLLISGQFIPAVPSSFSKNDLEVHLSSGPALEVIESKSDHRRKILLESIFFLKNSLQNKRLLCCSTAPHLSLVDASRLPLFSPTGRSQMWTSQSLLSLGDLGYPLWDTAQAAESGMCACLQCVEAGEEASVQIPEIWGEGSKIPDKTQKEQRGSRLCQGD